MRGIKNGDTLHFLGMLGFDVCVIVYAFNKNKIKKKEDRLLWSPVSGKPQTTAVHDPVPSREII